MICMGPEGQLWLSWFDHDHISLYVSVFFFIYFLPCFWGKDNSICILSHLHSSTCCLKVAVKQMDKASMPKRGVTWTGILCWWHYVDEFVYISLYQRGDPSRGENACGKCWVFFGLTFGVWRRIFEAVWRNDPWVIDFLGGVVRFVVFLENHSWRNGFEGIWSELVHCKEIHVSAHVDISYYHILSIYHGRPHRL